MDQFESFPERAYESLKSPRFEVEFEFYWKRLSSGMEYIVDGDALEVLKANSLTKEYNFYEVCNKAIKDFMQNEPPTTFCLFDIDGTMGEIKDDSSSEIYTLLRPSVTPLISNLAISYPESLRFGLLSLRPQSSLDEEMDNPTFLAPVRAFMDERLAFSSEVETKMDPLMRGTNDAAYLGHLLLSLEGVVEEETLCKTADGTLDIFEWYDPKLKMIANILKFNPNAACIVVDDLPYIDAIKKTNKNVRGICVESERQILIPS